MKATSKIFALLLLAATPFTHGQNTEPDGRTYAVRTMTLKQDANAMAFEKYAKEILNPTFRQVPGVTARIAKADRGKDKGVYLLLYFYDSKATRDHYYPIADSDEYSKAAEEMTPRIEKAIRGLYAFVEEDAETSPYTDYVFIE
ncbi:hypothetical protein [Maribacter sp. 2307ULW6-5]|uniref:hypothetical protein n=1 Tax=Maribacter sp. 2307ULW6-5 TaxID=3386275 RepID=UPI0039BD4719